MTLQGPYGTVKLSIVTGFEAKQVVNNVKVDPLTGPPLNAKVPRGWSGSFSVDRASDALDSLVSQIEQGFWASGALGSCDIYQYITELDGSTTTYHFDNVAISLSNAGNYQADQAVKQTLEFDASTRKRV
ncbi:hypothetical protein [Acidocella aminolytica]|uniref:hypothetical protein n=1 Tax=Acidocella aminolytica TaxID=33998 RepID=UPI001F524C81|nr:hypothetical protein [Acidocella aminolytica]